MAYQFMSSVQDYATNTWLRFGKDSGYKSSNPHMKQFKKRTIVK